MNKKRGALAFFLLICISGIGLVYGQVANNWDWELGEATLVPNTVNLSTYQWYPDGHIPTFPDGAGNYVMFWPEFHNYRSIGPTPFPEDHTALSPETSVFGVREQNVDVFNNNGSWILSAFKRGSDSVIAFAHCEYIWPIAANPDWRVWKSISVAYSNDLGQSFTEGGQILSAGPPPDTATHGGLGDHCAVWDEANNRWFIIYQHSYLSAAVSYDPLGLPGTWKKYYNGDFTEPGLGGMDEALPGLANFGGSGISIHWNTYLEKWILMWHDWASPWPTYIVSSTDLVNWDPPRILLETADRRTWYPTIIGESDVLGGKHVSYYYADGDTTMSSRNFMRRDLEFFRDTIPPLISSITPTVYSTMPQARLSVTTNENSDMRWSFENVSFDAMTNEFTGQGSKSHFATITFTEPGDYTIYLRANDLDGNVMDTSASVVITVTEAMSVQDEGIPLPSLNGLQFLGFTDHDGIKIGFREPAAGNSKLKVYDINRRLIASASCAKGEQYVSIDGFRGGPGMYLVSLEHNGIAVTGKMIMMNR